MSIRKTKKKFSLYGCMKNSVVIKDNILQSCIFELEKSTKKKRKNKKILSH